MPIHRVKITVVATLKVAPKPLIVESTNNIYSTKFAKPLCLLPSPCQEKVAHQLSNTSIKGLVTIKRSNKV